MSDASRAFTPTVRSLIAIFAAAVAAATWAQPAQAVEYPWCVHYGADEGGHNCGFVSQAQCLATARGAGGMCSQNPMYQGSPAAAPSGRRVRHRTHY